MVKMICDKYCDCILCLELRGCETNIRDDVNHLSDSNFILTKPDKTINELDMGNGKKYTFFGMQVDGEFEKFSTIGKSEDECRVNVSKIEEKIAKIENTTTEPKEQTLKPEDNSVDCGQKHKSVIYVNDVGSNSAEDSKEEIIRNEYIDEWMSLCSRENTTEINVVFKNTFSLASQIINEVHSSSACQEENDDEDDFPLGMEADLLKHYLRERLSCNSKNDHSYQLQSTDSSGTLNNELPSNANSPNNCNKSSNTKPFPSTNTPNQSTTVRMVSPKRRVEQFQQLFVANNVKTSTFSEQFEKNNLSNAKNTTSSHEFKHICSHNSIMVPEKDTGPKPMESGLNSVNSLKLPMQSKVKMNGGINNDEHRIVSAGQHNHISVHELRMQQRQQNCNSSSDDNRSSGHASMSDTGNSSPREVSSNDRLTTGVIQKPLRNRTNAHQYNRSRHRATPARLHVPWSGGGGLEDIKLALQQLTIRSNTSTSTYSSISAGSESSEPAMRRLMRHSSLETINTNITSADEFVWVDSHNRLVELQHLPWTNHCILRVLQTGRCRDYMSRVNVDIIPRLSYLLQRALVRIGRETQRLASTLGICSKHDITASFRIVLCPPLADSCIKAALRAAAMLSMSGDGALKQSKSSRAGLQLHVGRFHRWMTDLKLARFIHEYAAVYLCAGMENLLEEILLQCLPSDGDASLTATLLEHAIANNGDMWGLLQPYAHLNAGRIASGALALPRWASASSVCSSRDSGRSSAPSEPSVMTTCVGSLTELQDLIDRMQPRIPLCQKAVRALFYFMRCSQLEQGEQGNHIVQELCYERAYVVLPPLVEWLRVATAHGEHRCAAILDKDDIMQAARLLLPGVDCPVRSLGEEAMRVRKNTGNEEDQFEASRQIQIEIAFRLMVTGRPELIQQAISLLPATTRLDTLNTQGHTALMLAAINNDDQALLALLESGASVDIETPASGSIYYPAVNGECQYWTALTYAAAKGHIRCARILLERGANVEGGALLSEEKCTLTPLQVACGSGNSDMVNLLLAHGGHPFLSTQIKDSLSYSAAAQRGCYSALSVASAHGHRATLQKLLSQPLASVTKEVLSLEEMLAEGTLPNQSNNSSTPQFSKTHIKSLQEAMYQSAENNHLDITIEIRSLGIPWTLHCWMHSLRAAHEARLDCVIDQLLQDFLQVCPDDYSSQFVHECLPLLFNIFRYSKKEGTTLLLADIFSTCYGWEPIKLIKDSSPVVTTGSRIDPKYVNNPELSDVTFRVEGRLFYAHKIVLVTASPRLRAMLSSKLCEGGLPIVQINDIRYHIFEIVMKFLYQGGCQALEPPQEDILELMAAANFFQLDGLLRYCESRCATMVALDNVVSMYIHAKVYNAMQLLEYCQGFLMQNMVALLTYDDSVKRLLFAKKVPNHDVLGGLLTTLQNRIKTRRNHNNCKVVQNPKPLT